MFYVFSIQMFLTFTYHTKNIAKYRVFFKYLKSKACRSYECITKSYKHGLCAYFQLWHNNVPPVDKEIQVGKLQRVSKTPLIGSEPPSNDIR